MINYTFDYEDIDGNTRTKTIELHMSKASFIRFSRTREAKKLDAYQAIVAEASNPNTSPERVKELNDQLSELTYDMLDIFIKLSYGHRVSDPDGTNATFKRDPDETKAFLESDEYGDFQFDVLSDSTRFQKLMANLIPNVAKEAINTEVKKASTDGTNTLNVGDQQIALTPEMTAALLQLSAKTNAQETPAAPTTPAITAE
jgi:phytoene dehydrogenase-like protein